MMNAFIQRTKQLIKRRAINQLQLAAMLEITPTRLNSYLSGKAEAPYRILAKIADALQTTTDYLLGLTNDCGESYETPAWARYAGFDSDTGEVYIEIPLFSSSDAQPIGYHKCAAVLKNMYENPYAVKITDNSMAPYCTENDIALIAPRVYIPPVINNLDPARLYAVRQSPNEQAAQIRFCMSKDDILFIRPSDIQYKTSCFNISKLEINPVGGVVIAIIKYLVYQKDTIK